MHLLKRLNLLQRSDRGGTLIHRHTFLGTHDVMDPHRTSNAHQGETVNFVDPPHPSWKAGDKLPHNFGSDKYIDLLPEEIGNEMYPAIISSICPRPIGFVCCLNRKGQRNLSPYSYCNAMHHDPPLVVLGSSRHGGRGGARKDMEEYVRETGYVVSVSSAVTGPACFV